MRKINKGNPLPSFTTFSANNPNATWNDFHSKAHGVYSATRDQIVLVEQEGICGYTEIPFNDFSDCHLDHYKKRALYPTETFNWQNLIAAGNDDEFGARYKDLAYNIKVTEYREILNPVVDNVENYFYYTENGDILPSDTLSAQDFSKAELTIKVFNLRHKSLKQRRMTLIKQIKDCDNLESNKIKEIFAFSGFKSVLYQYI